jgi:DNA-binding NarL/FixJ family response regulator
LRAKRAAAIVVRMTGVLIVDDHPAVRAGVQAILGAEPGLRILAAVPDVRRAERACAERRPDVVVTDYHLPDGDGVSLCMKLVAGGGPRVVLYSTFADEHLEVLALLAGAAGVVPKGGDPADVVRAVHAASRGDRDPIAVSPRALRAAGSLLDPVDLPVLGMLAAGTPTADIAATLSMSEEQLTARRRAMLGRVRREPRRRPARGRRHGASAA